MQHQRKKLLTEYIFSYTYADVSTNGCVKRSLETTDDEDGHYCVCNATYCDTAPHVSKPRNPKRYFLITSSKSGLRFHISKKMFKNINPNNCKYSKISHPK